MLPDWIKEYLSFHKKERRGILILIVVVLALSGYNIYQRVFWQSDWEEEFIEFGPKIIAFKEKVDSMEQSENDYQPWEPRPKKLFKFDPNTLDSAGWVDLGFSPKQSAAILNYRKAGAVFRKPADVKRLFVVDEELYQELQPYIYIDESQFERQKPKYEPKKKYSKPKKEYEKVIVELNSADTALLMKLYGIGPSFSKRIVKYRALLGGYVSKEQMLEVYGMESARYLKIADQLKVNTELLDKVNVNQVGVKGLMRHPYINPNQARAIVNYRKQHGQFEKLAELKKIHLIDDSTYIKIAPYCVVK